jgi:hypothetical protein
LISNNEQTIERQENRSQDDSAKDDELMSTRSRSAEHHLNQ